MSAADTLRPAPGEFAGPTPDALASRARARDTDPRFPWSYLDQKAEHRSPECHAALRQRLQDLDRVADADPSVSQAAAEHRRLAAMLAEAERNLTAARGEFEAAGAGVKVEENWFDKAGNPVQGDIFRHMKPLQPGEVITISFKVPRSPNMQRNQYLFSHANGNLKQAVVPKLEVPKT